MNPQTFDYDPAKRYRITITPIADAVKPLAPVLEDATCDRCGDDRAADRDLCADCAELIKLRDTLRNAIACLESCAEKLENIDIPAADVRTDIADYRKALES